MPGWLTPNTPPPDKVFVRRLFIPAQNDWLALVDGALNELTKAYNWQLFGDMSVDDTVAAFDAMYQLYIENDNEPPYSENAADEDGTPAHPWYEALEDWIIAGFLAVTFTPAAAIVYQATVPKLRVAFRTGDIGALFRVLINGVEIWSGDSYSPIVDIIDQVFDTTAYTPPYTVRIEHNGIGGGGGTRSKLEYIREDAVAEMIQTILRADPTGCGVQWSLDNGGTWDTIDLAECIGDISTDRIRQAIEDGTIPSGGQSPTGAPETGSCATYHVRLSANSAWPCPSPLNPGDTVTVSGIDGAWNDGSGFGAIGPWFCPADGSSYGAGACGDNDGTPTEGDPSTENHMALIGHVDEWFLAAAGYTVPEGVSNGILVFQANDSAIADNLGEVTFSVVVCTGAVLNCHIYDFTVSEGIFVNWGIPGHPEVPGGYDAGEGYYGGFARDVNSVGIYTPTTQPGAFNWEEVSFEVDSTESGTVSVHFALYDPNSTSSTWIDFDADIVPGVSTVTRAGHFEFPAVGMYWYQLITPNMHLRSIAFHGTNRAPTGSSAC